MKRLLLFTIALAALPAAAQPVRDLVEGMGAVRQHQRDMEPAIALAKETQLALRTLTGVQMSLQGATGTLPLDKAVQMIDAYMKDLTDRRSYLPRDVMALMNRARTMFDQARIGAPPGDLQPLRDKFHHQIVAAVERRVLQDVTQMEQLGRAYEGLIGQMRVLQSAGVALAAEAAREPGKPDD